MSYDTFLNAQSITKNNTSKFSDVTHKETHKINGIMDIARDFETIVFNPHHTLIRSGHTLPAGAVAVPRLRQLGVKLAAFSEDGGDLTHELNRLGFSFAPERIFNAETFFLVFETFALTRPERMLFVTANTFMDLSLAHTHGLKTLLIHPGGLPEDDIAGLNPHYVADSL